MSMFTFRVRACAAAHFDWDDVLAVTWPGTPLLAPLGWSPSERLRRPLGRAGRIRSPVPRTTA